jgi:hypothetical protein
MSTPSLTHTYFGSTLVAGSALTEATNGGYATLMQTISLTSTADGLAVSGSISIPAGSQIVNFFVDTLTAPVAGAGTATTAPITIGTAAAGTQYLSATDCFTAGRTALAFTAAQLTAMSNVSTNTSVFATVDPNGTIVTTQGVWLVTVVYAMK